MKHFIYLDRELLNSYASQIFDGLLKANHSETSDQSNNQHTTNKSGAGLGGGVNLAVFKASISGQRNSEEITIENATHIRELVEKNYHDNIVDHFIKYLHDNNLMHNNFDNVSVGDFVCSEEYYEACDLGDISSYFDEENSEIISKALFMNDLKLVGLSQNATALGDLKSCIAQTKLEVFDDARPTIRAMLLMIPFENFIAGEDFLSPLKKECLLEGIPQIRFKHSGKVTILGRITKDKTSKSEKNFLGSSVSAINDMGSVFYKHMLLNEEKLIATPIALYFQ